MLNPVLGSLTLSPFSVFRGIISNNNLVAIVAESRLLNSKGDFIDCRSSLESTASLYSSSVLSDTLVAFRISTIVP